MSAFERLVERNRDDLYSFALWMTRSETEATQIAQESFLSACQHLSHFRNEAEFRAWAHWIAAKHISIRRRPRRTSPVAEGPPKAPESRAVLAHNSGAGGTPNSDEPPLNAGLSPATLEYP